VVCGAVHIGILGSEVNCHGVLARFERSLKIVRHTPVVPVGNTAVRHHDDADAFAVDAYGTDSALVLGVYGTVAVGVAYGERVCTVGESIKFDSDGAGAAVDLHKAIAGEAFEWLLGLIRHLFRSHNGCAVGSLEAAHWTVAARL